MATFETAAEELAKKIATLDEMVEKADDRLETLRQELTTLEEGVNEDFSELISQAQSFFSKLQEERETLARECGEAGQKISEAEGQVGQSRGEAEGDLGEGRGRLEGLAASVGALSPQVEGMVAEGAEAPSQALGQMAESILGSMKQALEGARELLDSEVSDELDQLRRDVEQRVDAVEEAARTAGERVDRAYADFAAHLTEATDLVEEQAFAAAGKHIKEVVDYAIEECGKAHEEEIKSLSETAGDLARLLEGLKDELETARDRMRDEGEEPLRTDMGELTSAVGAAQSALDQVKSLLASYTFVQV